MARIILILVAAVAALVVLWIVFASIWHFLVLGFVVFLVLLLGYGLFRIGRWSSSRE